MHVGPPLLPAFPVLAACPHNQLPCAAPNGWPLSTPCDRYVATMLHRGQDTCLAKILGVYQVGWWGRDTGTRFQSCLL